MSLVAKEEFDVINVVFGWSSSGDPKAVSSLLLDSIESTCWVPAWRSDSLIESSFNIRAFSGNHSFHGAVSMENIEGWESLSGEGRLWDWSKSLGQDVSHVHTEILEIGFVNIGGNHTNIGFKTRDVGHSVSHNGLNQLAFVVEDGRPFFDSSFIVFHSLAVFDITLDSGY